MLILGIETSCDETAAAVVDDGTRILSSIVSSQAAIHAPFGGVVPELASRHHIENICPVISSAMAEAAMEYAALDAVAVTQGPGLVGSLLVGVQAAQGPAHVHGQSLVPLHPNAGHPPAPLPAPAGAVRPPALAPRVSRGHTSP